MSERMDTEHSCGDLVCEILVSPVPRPKAEPLTVHTTPRDPNRVVLVDIRKPNSGEILKAAAKVLRAAGVDVELIDKRAVASSPMRPDEVLELADQHGYVITGVAD